MRKQKNISQKVDEILERNPKDDDLTITDLSYLDVYKDPIYLAQELNRDLSGMRDDIDKHLRIIKISLIIIAIVLILIFLKY